MLISIILMSLFAGYVFYRTKSLIPVIVAHALANIPYRGGVDNYLIFFLLAIIILFLAIGIILGVIALILEFREKAAAGDQDRKD